MNLTYNHLIILLSAMCILSFACSSPHIVDIAIKKQEAATYYYDQKDYAKSRQYCREAVDLWSDAKYTLSKSIANSQIEDYIDYCENLMVICDSDEVPSEPQLQETVTTIPVSFSNNSIFVEAILNSRETFTLLFDTGASQTIIDDEVAETLNIAPTENTPQRTFRLVGGEKIKAHCVRLSKLKIGKAMVKNLMVGVYDLDKENSQFEGILGYDFMKHFIVTVDNKASQIRLESQN